MRSPGPAPAERSCLCRPPHKLGPCGRDRYYYYYYYYIHWANHNTSVGAYILLLLLLLLFAQGPCAPQVSAHNFSAHKLSAKKTYDSPSYGHCRYASSTPLPSRAPSLASSPFSADTSLDGRVRHNLARGLAGPALFQELRFWSCCWHTCFLR